MTSRKLNWIEFFFKALTIVDFSRSPAVRVDDVSHWLVSIKQIEHDVVIEKTNSSSCRRFVDLMLSGD